MTIFGSDVSHYDAADTRAMFADGIVFQTHKAGGDANDAELASWWGYVKNSRDQVLLGAYWVLYPGSPAARADAFLARLDSQCPGWRDGPFILQADCEKWNGDAGTVPSVAEVNAFCDRLALKMPKLVPIAYMPDWVYGDLSALRYPLWSSKYVGGNPAGYRAMYPGDSSSKWAAYGGRTPDVLQYTSSATIGGQTTCDANAYRGTLAELIALLAPGWETDMPLTNADADVLLKRDAITNPKQRGDSATNPTTTWGYAVSDTWQQVYNLRDQMTAMGKSLSAAIAALAGKDFVDEQALADALAGGVAAAVIAGLPADRDDITAEELAEAVREVAREAFAPQAGV